MNIGQWRVHCWNALEAAGVSIETFPSGAIRIKGRGADVTTADIGALSRDELNRLTQGRAHTPYNDLTGYAVANSPALQHQTD